jgi:hypothetical protein
MSREAIRKTIQNLNILFAQYNDKKYTSKKKLVEFENLVIFNLRKFTLYCKELNDKEKLNEIDSSILKTNYQEILKKVEPTFEKLNIKYKFPSLFVNTEIVKIETMTDPIQTVLKIMNTVYDGKPKNVGFLPTIISQIELIALKVTEPDDIALAISAIKTRFSDTALTAVSGNVTTFQQIIDNLRRHCSGDPSWNITTELQGVRFRSDKTEYIKNLEKITDRLKFAYLNEGTAQTSAEKYCIKETVKNIKTNFMGNTEMVSSMNNNFASVNEVY